MKKGFLVTFEGGEGCGKSTQIKLLASFLESQKHPYIISREPGGTELGEEIRKILLHSKKDISSKVEFLLFSAARAEHVEKVINPALNEGKIVLLDRYFDSSFTYQGYAGDLELKDLKSVTEFAVGDAVPDLTFLLDLSFEEGLKRKAKDESLKKLDRIEQKNRDYHEKVRKGYLTLAKENKNRIVVIDASKSLEEVSEEIKQMFLKRYR